tara:strand:+ start:5349 stop:5714 length:366 start_codon:yes stop_codon:yes gene_type:complete
MHKILIVDDEQDILETVSDIVEDKFSCETDSAANGLDAFILCQKEKYDLIITDHNMPFMKGSAFIIGLRTKENQNKNTPIIMLSAFIDEKMKKTLQIQNVDFLEKPFSPVDLIQMVRDHLI